MKIALNWLFYIPLQKIYLFSCVANFLSPIIIIIIVAPKTIFVFAKCNNSWLTKCLRGHRQNILQCLYVCVELKLLTTLSSRGPCALGSVGPVAGSCKNPQHEATTVFGTMLMWAPSSQHALLVPDPPLLLAAGPPVSSLIGWALGCIHCPCVPHVDKWTLVFSSNICVFQLLLLTPGVITVTCLWSGNISGNIWGKKDFVAFTLKVQ